MEYQELELDVMCESINARFVNELGARLLDDKVVSHGDNI